MNYNYILFSILFLFTTSTIITNGLLLSGQKNELNYSNLTSNNKLFVFSLIYTEIYLSIILIYNIIFYLYYCIYSCYSDGTLNSQFNCWKALFLFSGIGTHIILFINLINKTYINDNINIINIIFNINFIIIITMTLLFKYLKCKKKNRININ